MRATRVTIISVLILLLATSFVSGQNKLFLFATSGYTNHLTRNGINWELGVDYEILKQLGISVAYRYNHMNRQERNKVVVSNASVYLSWIILNKNSHRLMVGPGVALGRYLRYTNPYGFEKEYTDIYINPVRLQYDYTFTNQLKIGSIVGLYGDDGDGTNYLGVLLGYRF